MTTAASSQPSAPAQPPPTLTNETLRQRILIGGGKPDAAPVRGTLSKAVSCFRELISVLDTDAPDKVQDITTSLQSELALHDLEMRRLFLSARAFDAASAKSRSSLAAMTASQLALQNDIKTLTVELNNQKRIRKNREEYNTLAKMINSSHPAAAKTREECKAVEEEIAKTKQEVARAQWEIGIREKQVRVMMASLGDLKEVLRDEDWRKRRNEALSRVGGEGDDSSKKEEGDESEKSKKRMKIDGETDDSDTAGAL